MNALKFLLFTLTVSFCIPASAQLYKWVDENGDYHISDRPPLDYDKADIKNKKKKKKVVKKKKPNKEVIAWRCKELEQQYESALNKAMRFATDKSLAATMKSDAENYKKALDKICR